MIKYIILGIVQGLTEFFPVSSSGHLAILLRAFGISSGQVAISVILHLGTLLALCIFFFKEILGLYRRPKTLLLIFIVTCITGIIGISGKGFFEELFSNPKFVAFSWIVTGVILILTGKFTQAKRHTVNTKDALILGATQGIAIIPGISRSGITISTLLFRGLDRETSFRFSFLASIPAIVGAAMVEAKDINFVFQG
ncbi:MAG: undecaprenyl-diphosphate phosphatase, partial [Candidatus Omnitrophota bacterium]